MTPAEQNRVRIPRSRKGCVTCRSRHMKCDETKPACRMCAARDQECGGYQLDIRWSTKHEKRNQQRRARVLALNQSAIPRTDSRASRASPVLSGSEISSMPTVPGCIATLFPPLFNQLELNTTLFPVPADDLDAAIPIVPLGHYEGDTDESGGTMSDDGRHESTPTDASLSQVGSGIDMLGPVEGNITASEVAADSNMTFSQTIHISGARPDEYASGPSTISYMPSVFVEYWFRDICSLWSQYDSNTNLNRTIASALWSSSEAVYLSLQGMAAAYMSSKVHIMRQTSISSLRSAAEIVRADLCTVKTHQLFDSVPTGLLYALLCIGTSVCWLNATQLGLPFLTEVKELLHRLNQQKNTFSEDQLRILDFFNKSWLYCEMLLSMVTSTSKSLQKIEDIGEVDVNTSIGASLPLTPVDHSPHPWTGVSSTSSLLFMRAMKLCHKYRRVIRTQVTFASTHFTTAMQLIEQAAVVEGDIFELNIASLSFMGQTEDQKTPNKHLLGVAEAYRQAGLLQLYQTFPELVVRRFDLESTLTSDTPALWNAWITPIALNLVTLLEGLPSDSGSKMTQPLLCVAASTGLRQKPICTKPEDNVQKLNSSTKPSDDNIEDCDMLHYLDFTNDGSHEQNEPDIEMEADRDITAARQFIRDRLNILKKVLPPKPVTIAQTLTEAIWVAYDTEHSGAYMTHWIDIMNDQNLKSNFA